VGRRGVRRGDRAAPSSGRLTLTHLRWLRRPVVLDAFIVLVVAGLGAASTGDPSRGPDGPWWLLDLAVAVALLGRRRWPLAVWAWAAAVGTTQWGLGLPLTASLAVLASLYAVGAHQDRRWQVAVAALGTEVAIFVAAFGQSDDDLSALVLLTGTATAAWVIGVQLRTRRTHLASMIERAATAERERDQLAQIAVAEERDRISRELHDIVAHSVSVMIALSDGAAASVDRDPAAAKDALEQASTVGRQSLAEIRRLIGTVRDPELAPQPGVGDLEELVAQVRAGIPVELVVTGRLEDVPPNAQLSVYRIVQEGLTNVLKHASSARQAVVTLVLSPSSAQITVADDGVGAAAPDGAGHGLAGMRQRAALYGGEVTAGPAPGGGWQVATTLTFEGAP
jgi:signal transduction histidine kinase